MVPGPIIIIIISVVIIIMCAVCAETRRDCRSHHHWYEIGFYTTPGEANAFVSADRECRQLKNHIHKQTASEQCCRQYPCLGQYSVQLQSSLLHRALYLILIV